LGASLIASAAVQRAPSAKAAADNPIEVAAAIVHILSVRDMGSGVSLGAQDVGPGGEQISAPGYYIDIKKSIREKTNTALLWEWYRIALGTETDGRGERTSITGSAARERIAKADAQTRPLLKAASGGPDGGKAVFAGYAKAVAELTSRAAREEVATSIDAGMARERLSREGGEKKEGTEAEETESLLRQMVDLNLELVEATHKVSEHYGEQIHEAAAKGRELFDERMHEYLTKVFKEHDVFAEAPEPREFEHASSKFATGMAFVKGGLDAGLAIMAIADPKKRAELFATHGRFFGKVGVAAEVTKVLMQFASAGVAYYGYATYSVAKVTGNSKLAEEILDLTAHRVGSVASGLYIVGAIHGVAVLLDPGANAEQRGEAAVETITNAVALGGTVGRSIPMLEGAAGWSGPVAASLSINWMMLKKAASMYEDTKESIASLGGRGYREEAFDAAREAQEWMSRLAVSGAILATETDEPRRKELEKTASAARWALMEQVLKPYFAKLFGAEGKQDDEGRVGLRALMRPVVPFVDKARYTGEALEAGATFLEALKAAFENWGKVVLKERDPVQPDQFVGRRAVVIKNVQYGTQLPPGVIHIRNDADKAAGREASVVPDEPYLKARTDGSELLPGQVVKIVLVEKGEAWVDLDSLRTPVLEVSATERVMAEQL
jgi:hypothetical protein